MLACEVDRASWCHSCRPRPRAPALLVARMLKYLEPALALVPGLPDRWLRRLGFAVKVVRQLGRFA